MVQVGFLEVCSLLPSRVLFKSSPNQHPFVTNHLKVSWSFNPKSVATQTQTSVFVMLMAKILDQLIGSLSNYLPGFLHTRWLFGISSINGMSPGAFKKGRCSSTKWCPYKTCHNEKNITKLIQTYTAVAGILQGPPPPLPSSVAIS